MIYLGKPHRAHYKGSSIWNPIIEKMERRLSGWKYLYMLKGGWLNLLKRTLSSLPTYFLSMFTIPQVVVARLERIKRNFLWGAFEDVFKYLLVAWNKVCLLVEVGRLGIWRFGLFNQALLGKWLWCFGKESNRLWHHVIATKYGLAKGGWCARGVRGIHRCGMWKSIREGAESFSEQIVYNLGRVIVLDSSMILGMGILLLRIFFHICWLVLFLKKLGFLTW